MCSYINKYIYYIGKEKKLVFPMRFLFLGIRDYSGSETTVAQNTKNKIQVNMSSRAAAIVPCRVEREISIYDDQIFYNPTF